MQLDFTNITDDQLIDLIRAALAEAVARGHETRVAAETSAMEAQAKAREEAAKIAAEAQAAIERERLAAEAAKTAATWEYKDRVGRELSDLLRPHKAMELAVWSRGADKRIYVDGGGRRHNTIEYYHTGNQYKRPGYLGFMVAGLSITDAEFREITPALKQLLGELCDKWSSLRLPIPAYQPAKQQEVA